MEIKVVKRGITCEFSKQYRNKTYDFMFYFKFGDNKNEYNEVNRLYYKIKRRSDQREFTLQMFCPNVERFTKAGNYHYIKNLERRKYYWFESDATYDYASIIDDMVKYLDKKVVGELKYAHFYYSRPQYKFFVTSFIEEINNIKNGLRKTTNLSNCFLIKRSISFFGL